VQGSRDSFGTPAELQKIIKRDKLSATLFEIETGDHSFKILKSVKLTQDEVHEAIMDQIVNWVSAGRK
jgi:predicted alpha/beta-hydrolase family hydrolase